jgi:hypothetical protein
MNWQSIRQWAAAGALAAIVAACGSEQAKTTAATATRSPSETATPEPAPSAPAALRGSWKRTMRQRDWKPAGRGYPLGTFRLDIDSTGSMNVYFPHTKTVDFSTEFVATGRRMTIDSIPVCPGVKGRYNWRASARQMTLSVVSDAHCVPRAALFAGTWRRRQ